MNTEPIDELIQLRGQRFHYRVWPCKSKSAPVLVLLHGFTGHARSWDSFARQMCHRYTVYALDQRGHGESDWSPNAAYGVSEMVEDFVAFVRSLGFAKFHLLGLSMGGIVSFHYAGRRPTELERLVIVDIAPRINTVGASQIQEGVARSDIFNSVEEAFTRARRDNPVPPVAHQFNRVRHSLMRTEDGKWTYRYDRALRDSSRTGLRVPTEEEGWEAVQSINVPTLLIRGENSHLLTRETAEEFVYSVNDGTLIEIPGSGHPVPLDKPIEFLSAVDTFL